MLNDISTSDLDRMAGMGLGWVCCLSVWSTTPAGRRLSRTKTTWRREFGHTLDDLHDEDVGASSSAITAWGYHVFDVGVA